MLDVDIQKLKRLFQEKRYSEVVFEIEASTTEKNRSSALYNLLGLRASQKAKTDRDIQHAFMILKPFYKDNLVKYPLILYVVT